MVYVVFFFLGILTLPTNLAQIIPLLKRKNPPPAALYFSSILVNMGIAFLISAIDIVSDDKRSFEMIGYIIAAIFFYVGGVIMSFINLFACDSCEGFNDFEELNEELKTEFDDYETLTNKLMINRALPPLILVIGKAYHYETETEYYTDSDGNQRTRSVTKEVTTYKNSWCLRYQSWQEEGNSIRIDKDLSMIHGRVEAYFTYDNETIDVLNRMREVAYQDARPHDTWAYAYNEFWVPEKYEIINGTTRTDGSVPCVSKWIPTIGGRILIIFLKIIGYSTLIYALWTSKGTNMKMKIIKRVSMKPKHESGLRCGYMENDQYAAERTFHGKKKTKYSNQKQNQNSISEICEDTPNVVSGINNDGELNVEKRKDGS